MDMIPPRKVAGHSIPWRIAVKNPTTQRVVYYDAASCEKIDRPPVDLLEHLKQPKKKTNGSNRKNVLARHKGDRLLL